MQYFPRKIAAAFCLSLVFAVSGCSSDNNSSSYSANHDVESATLTPAPTPSLSNPIEEINHTPTISGIPETSAEVTRSYRFLPSASDVDGDTLSFSIENKPSWLSFDATKGELIGQPAPDDVGSYENIVIRVADAESSAALPAFAIQVLAAPPPPVSKLDAALSSGSVADITAEALLDAALAEIAAKKAVPSLLSDLYGNEVISYTPGNRTQVLNLGVGVEDAFPILQGNQGKVLGIAGTTAQGRYAAFGMSPTELFQDGTSLVFTTPFKRLLAWLLGGEPIDVNQLTGQRTIALSFVNNDRTNITEWLAAEQPDWQVVTCDDVAELSTCYGSADLVMTGWQGSNSDTQAIKQALSDAMDNGKPVLYVHTHYEATNDVADAIADLLNFSLPYGGNYWAKDAAEWASVEAMQASIVSQQGLDHIETMLNHFKAGDYAFDWSLCEGEDCSALTALDTEFQQGASSVRTMMTELDENKVNAFNQTGLRLQKLLALLGDKYRQAVQFPMDKNSTTDDVLLKAYFADHAVYNYRRVNPVQPDMGNFSRSDFSHITPMSKTIERMSKVKFRSAGVYALPGETVQVTRLDNSDLTVKVFVNSLRASSTHQWAEDGYKRPKYLQSAPIPISSGETIEFTSTYGGPLQIELSANDLPVQLHFENIGEHPYWASSDDDERFTQALAAGEYDWAELVTPGFEVHSQLDKMRTSMQDANWGSAQALSEATMRYVHNFPHVLAGFQGPGIDVVPEIHDFANSKAWTINTIDLVKHMNADQASCGYGCSGNPYDAYWAFNPIGHGDIHELGHGLERNRFRFTGWGNHSQTNPYSYYTKSQFYQDTGREPSCQSLPFETAFNALQASVGQLDSVAYMQSQYWANSNWSHQVLMTIQLMMEVQYQGVLQDGWHLLARLHIHDREFRRADNNDTDWEAGKASLGFSSYTREEAIATSNDDYMLLALSTLSGLDLRDYLTMWGISFSQKAAEQVASYAYPTAGRRFFISSPDGYCKGEGFDGDNLPVDGSQVWPATAQSARFLPTSFTKPLESVMHHIGDSGSN